jgi:hypothetical protein
MIFKNFGETIRAHNGQTLGQIVQLDPVQGDMHLHVFAATQVPWTQLVQVGARLVVVVLVVVVVVVVVRLVVVVVVVVDATLQALPVHPLLQEHWLLATQFPWTQPEGHDGGGE